MVDSVQVFGRKKTSVAVAYCKRGRGLIKVNGQPIEFVQPELLRLKVLEPLLVLGPNRFQMVDIRCRVQGGGYTSQIYGQPHAQTDERRGSRTPADTSTVSPSSRTPSLQPLRSDRRSASAPNLRARRRFIRSDSD